MSVSAQGGWQAEVHHDIPLEYCIMGNWEKNVCENVPTSSKKPAPILWDFFKVIAILVP